MKSDLDNLKNIQTSSFSEANVLQARAGTTGPKGGDAGHGAMAFFELQDQGGTCWDVEIETQDGKTHEYTNGDGSGLKSVKLVLRGDSEIRTFQKSLELGSRVLRTK